MKFLLSVSASDIRSLTGSNLRSIQVQTGIQDIPGVSQVSSIKKHCMFPVPQDQKWKVPLLHSLLAIRADEFEIPLDNDEIDENVIADTILENICTS